jgi:hypothetical protein
MFTDKNTRENREKICNNCENKIGVKCNVCGCFVIFLKKIELSQCPKNKW